MQKVVLGALAGLSATMAMTVAMRHLFRHLPSDRRYPLPPREIIERVAPGRSEKELRTGTLLAHFGYGALAGAIFSKLPSRTGIPYGLAVWALSYLGWIPVAGILAPATRHPPPRNFLMLAAHVVWGAALQLSLRELEASAEQPFADGPTHDAWRRRR